MEAGCSSYSTFTCTESLTDSTGTIVFLFSPSKVRNCWRTFGRTGFSLFSSIILSASIFRFECYSILFFVTSINLRLLLACFLLSLKRGILFGLFCSSADWFAHFFESFFSFPILVIGAVEHFMLPDWYRTFWFSYCSFEEKVLLVPPSSFSAFYFLLAISQINLQSNWFLV